MTPDTKAPFTTLQRHFFQSFFRLSFLDDAGEESFKRAIIYILAAAIAFGLFLARLYVGKYSGLGEAPEIRLIVTADRLMLIALPMFFTTLLMALVSHSIFPDEIDFRTLMALPLSRRSIFAAKFAALLLFAVLVIGGVNGGLTLPLGLVVNSHSPGQSVMAAIAVQTIVGLWSSAYAAASIVALQGLVAVALPRMWLRRASIALQTALVAGLVLSLPFLARLPEFWLPIDQGASWLFFVPAGWFLGLQEWLLNGSMANASALAAVAVGSTAMVAMICIVCSLLVYRRFDQSVLRPAAGSTRQRWNIRIAMPLPLPPARTAVSDFIGATLRRSGLHQLVFATVFAGGVALAVNSLVSSIGLSPRWLTRAVLGVPFTVMAGAVVGLRMALLLPTNLRAGWIFKFTEVADARRHQLDAVRYALFSTGVVLPTALAFPIQFQLLGREIAFAAAPMTLLIGWVFTEVICLDWRRIPFTCTFLFAKRPPAFTLFAALMIFGWFVFISTSLVDSARRGRVAWLVTTALVIFIGSALRWYRLQNWGRWPLEFEDYLPDSLETLRLGD